MSCHHIFEPRPEMGGYIIRDVHDGKPDGIFSASTCEEEAITSSAAALLAVQGYACRLMRIADEALFEAQEQSYIDEVCPPGCHVISAKSGELPAQLAARMLLILRGNSID